MSFSEFHGTNKCWNHRRFNDNRTIGKVMSLVRQHAFPDFPDWERWYFDNVMDREKMLKHAHAFMLALRKFYGIEINHDQAFYITHYRILCETWAGYVRELGGLAFIVPFFPRANFRHVDEDEDVFGVVDFQMDYGGDPVLGIQIKPVSLLSGSEWSNGAFRAVVDRIAEYQERNPHPVWIVCCQINGVPVHAIKFNRGFVPIVADEFDAEISRRWDARTERERAAGRNVRDLREQMRDPLEKR